MTGGGASSLATLGGDELLEAVLAPAPRATTHNCEDKDKRNMHEHANHPTLPLCRTTAAAADTQRRHSQTDLFKLFIIIQRNT